MSFSRFPAAVVGTGFIGPVHIEALRRLGVSVLGVVGSTPERGAEAARRLDLPKAYPSLSALLDDPEVRVVHLTSPNHLHHEQCRQVLAAGKHLICEKPLALTSQETGELVQLARSTPVVTAVNYNIRYYPLCLECRQRIHEGMVGAIYHVTGSYLQDWLFHDTDFNWRVLEEQGGTLRAVADIGTHWLDLITWILGQEVESVCAELRTLIPVRQNPKGSIETFQSKTGEQRSTEPVPIRTEDYASVLLRFRGGGSGCFTVSQVAAGRKNCLRFEISGSRSALAWNSEEPNDLWIGHRDQPNELLVRDPALLHESARQFASYPGGHAEGFPDTFKQLFRDVYAFIEAGDFEGPRTFPTFADGHREALLCEAILRSHQEQRWVNM